VLQSHLTPDTTAYTPDLLSQLRTAERTPAQQHSVTAALLQYAAASNPAPTQVHEQLLEFSMADAADFMDDYAPTPAALLAGHNGSVADAQDLPPETNQPAAMWRAERQSAAAQRWISAAAPAQPTQGRLPGTYAGAPDAFGARATQQLRTKPVASTFFPSASKGVVLLEPFGGLCVGLEMALRNGTATQC
jgi:hypothetical protein